MTTTLKAPRTTSVDLRTPTIHPLPPTLSWLPQETLFSLCSRFHVVLGRPNPEQTSRILFGRSRGGVHDLPGHLDEWLIRRPRDQVAEFAAELAMSRTVLGFYRPFLTPNRVASAVQAMRTAGIGSLKFRLGLLTSRFPANHPLKGCAACIADDRTQHHVAYWHLPHQWPGVWLCPTHQQVLQVDTKRAAAGSRYAWCLPDEQNLQPALGLPASLTDRNELIALLSRLAALVLGVTSLPADIYIDRAALGRSYRVGLERHGLQRSSGRADHVALGHKLARDLAPLVHVPELSRLSVPPSAAAIQAIRVIQRPEVVSHPLPHISLMSSLFEDWRDFWTVYQACLQDKSVPRAPHGSPKTAGTAGRYSQDLHAQFLDLLSAGASPSQAARTLQTTPATGLAWAASAGIDTHRRPKQLKPPMLDQLITDLRQGMDKTTAAQRIGMSIQTVTTILRTEVGLHDLWVSARQERSLVKARTTWLQAMQGYGASGCTAARRHAEGAYAWLYRHDRTWLVEHSAPATPRIQSPPRGVDWTQRDRDLSARLKSLACSNSAAPIRLWQIYLQVPELKNKLNKIARLPMTRRAVEGLIGHPWTRKS